MLEETCDLLIIEKPTSWLFVYHRVIPLRLWLLNLPSLFAIVVAVEKQFAAFAV